MQTLVYDGLGQANPVGDKLAQVVQPKIQYKLVIKEHFSTLLLIY